MKAKTPSESRTVTSRIVRQPDVNSLGTTHGGYILEWMDTAASICARRHSNCRVNTVAVDELSFLKPLRVGHVATIESLTSRTFRTSMEVVVNVHEEDTVNAVKTLVATGAFTFVALDADSKPTAVAELLPQTEDDKKRWQEAGRRRLHRQQRQINT